MVLFVVSRSFFVFENDSIYFPQGDSVTTVQCNSTELLRILLIKEQLCFVLIRYSVACWKHEILRTVYRSVNHNSDNIIFSNVRSVCKNEGWMTPGVVFALDHKQGIR